MTSSATDPSSVAQPWRFTLRGLFVFITLLAVLSAAALSLNRARMAAHQAVDRSRTNGDFHRVLYALHLHDDLYGSLPYAVHLDTGKPDQLPSPKLRVDTGKPLYSWRFGCWIFLESVGRRLDFGKAWDSPELAAERALAHRIYCGERFGPESWNTRIFAVTGPGTAWGDGTTPPLSLEDVDRDTILIVRVRNSGTHWMQPGDFDIRTMPRTINARDGKGISGEYPDGFHVGLADASVRFVPSDVPFEVLEKFFTVEGAKQYDLDEELDKYSLK